MIPCPNRETLQQWLANQGGETAGRADDTHRSLVAHLEGCDHCQEVLASLTDTVGGFLPALAAGREDAPDARQPDAPVELPGYEVTERIGRGGMGAVYLARHRALDRHVAIKVLHADLNARAEFRERFEEEARIASQLQHPGVPPVHEFGTLSDGRPYFVMKVVRGRTLAGLLAERPAPAADLPRFLAMFEQVCQAVGYAHSHGVLHRDLKPHNVMVGAFAEVQVMDWGVAKRVLGSGFPAPRFGSGSVDATVNTSGAPPLSTSSGPSSTPVSAVPGAASHSPNSALGTGYSERTQEGTVLGTPAYIPPEQALGASDRVDRRSDVFGLGAILCEILTGQPPYDGSATDMLLQARAAALGPARVRLAASGAPPELIALASSCLSANPDGRPADGAAVADAVATYRTGVEERLRAVERERAAAEVRVAEQRKRRRVIAAASGAVMAVLALGAGIAGWQAVRATRAEGDAQTEAIHARTAEQSAVAESARAEGEAQKARTQSWKATDEAADRKAFSDFLTGNILAATRPKGIQGGKGYDIRMSEALRAAEKGLAATFAGRPKAEATARHALGVTWQNLAEYDRAEGHLERAVGLRRRELGVSDRETLNAINSLAVLRLEQGRHAEAQLLFEEVLNEDLKTVGEHHAATLAGANNLATLYLEQHKYAPAETLLVTVLQVRRKALGNTHPDTLLSANNLGQLYASWGRYPDAERLLVEVLAARRRADGNAQPHPDTLLSMNNLGSLYKTLRQYSAAEPLLTDALAGYEAVYGPDHDHVLNCMGNLAGLYKAQGYFAAAEPLLVKVLDGLRRVHRRDHDHPDVLRAANNLAMLYVARRDYPAAEPLLIATLASRRRKLIDDDEETLSSLNNLACLYHFWGNYAAAEPLHRDALAGRRKVLPHLHPSTRTSVFNSALLYFDARRFRDAVPLFREDYLAGDKLSESPLDVVVSRSYLGLSLLGTGQAAEAEQLLLRAAAELRQQKSLGPRNRNLLRWATQGLAELYAATDRPTEAAEWLAKLAALPPEVAPSPQLRREVAPPPQLRQ